MARRCGPGGGCSDDGNCGPVRPAGRCPNDRKSRQTRGSPVFSELDRYSEPRTTTPSGEGQADCRKTRHARPHLAWEQRPNDHADCQTAAEPHRCTFQGLRAALDTRGIVGGNRRWTGFRKPEAYDRAACRPEERPDCRAAPDGRATAAEGEEAHPIVPCMNLDLRAIAIGVDEEESVPKHLFHNSLHATIERPGRRQGLHSDTVAGFNAERGLGIEGSETQSEEHYHCNGAITHRNTPLLTRPVGCPVPLR